jgi:hypothetical protein
LPQAGFTVGEVLRGKCAPAQASECLSFIPGTADGLGQVEGSLVMGLRLAQATLDAVQSAHFVDRLDFAAPIADATKDGECRLQSLRRPPVILSQPPYGSQVHQGDSLANLIAEVAVEAERRF